MKKVTIKDIAREAGVAVSTVSYALNGSDKVGKATKEKIFKIAEELNFSLNGAAKDLKRNKTNLIGVFVTELKGPYYTDIVAGVQEFAHENEYGVVIGTDYGKNSTALKFLTEGRVDGAIISAPSISNKLLKQMAKRIPLVLLDREYLDDNLVNICIDNKKGIKEVLQHLENEKCKKIYVLTGKESYDNSERIKALEEERKNFHIEEITFFKGDFTESSGKKFAEKLIKQKKYPDAVIALNDEMAIGIIQYMKEHKIELLEKLKIVGFDNIQLSSYITPALTTVDYSRKDMGHLAAFELIKMLKKEESGNRKIILNSALVVRESTRKK